MTAINELFVFLGCAVVLVQSHMEGGVVAPAFVVFELVIRHEFDGVDAQTLQVVQRIQYHLVVTLAAKVTDEQFVDAQIGLHRSLESAVLPGVFWLAWLQKRTMPRSQARGIARQIGPRGGWNTAVVVGVQNQF